MKPMRMDKGRERDPKAHEVYWPTLADPLDWPMASCTEGWGWQKKGILMIPMELQGGNRK